jgi:hypothetical protein
MRQGQAQMATMLAKRKAKLLILIATQVATAIPLWANSNRRRVPDMLRAQLDQDQRISDPAEGWNFYDVGASDKSKVVDLEAIATLALVEAKSQEALNESVLTFFKQSPMPRIVTDKDAVNEFKSPMQREMQATVSQLTQMLKDRADRESDKLELEFLNEAREIFRAVPGDQARVEFRSQTVRREFLAAFWDSSHRRDQRTR